MSAGDVPAGDGTVVRARPKRLRRVCWFAAAAVVGLFLALSVVLGAKGEGGLAFHAGDQAAMAGLGLLVAAGILTLTRPRVVADVDRIRIRNVLGSYDLPWEVVLAVRFTDGSPWASLDLADDDQVALMAIQAVDKEYAVAAVAGLRRLLAASRAR